MENGCKTNVLIQIHAVSAKLKLCSQFPGIATSPAPESDCDHLCSFSDAFSLAHASGINFHGNV